MHRHLRTEPRPTFDAPSIKCIFVSEFHPTAGPVISCQVPDDYIKKEVVDSLQGYIITKPELHNKLITVTAGGVKILGCPLHLADSRYPRNALIFNVCLVFLPETDTAAYEVVVKKLAQYLNVLEVESQYLSQQGETRPQLCGVLRKIRQELNVHGTCAVPIDEANTIHLKVVRNYKVPPTVHDYDVPVIIFDQDDYNFNQWDLATQQVLPHLDGFKHVARIAAEADIEPRLVKALIQNLVHFELVEIVSIFQYSNIYCATPELTRKLYGDKKLQRECCKIASLLGKPLPTIDDVWRLFSSFSAEHTVKSICDLINVRSLNIDERKLIQFGLIHKLIRRIHKYPVKLPIATATVAEPASSFDLLQDLYPYFDGEHHLDSICCRFGRSSSELEGVIKSDPSVVLVSRPTSSR